MAASSWLRYAAGDPEPAARLVCFAHAGGGASAFNSWRAALPGCIELVKVQLPGREDRRDDEVYTQLDELIAELYPHVEALLDRPMAIYGHSVGSLLAFEVTQALRRNGHPWPLALLTSGRRAPHRPLREEHQLHALTDHALAGRVQELGGIPPGMLDTGTRRDHFLPRIRADLCLSDTYTYRDAPRLGCPLHTFIGERDDLVARRDWEAWSEHAAGEFTRRVLPGGHFFSREGQAELIGEVTRVVMAALTLHGASAALASAGRAEGSPALGEAMRSR